MVEFGIGDIGAVMLAALSSEWVMALCDGVTIDLDIIDVEV